MRSNPGTRDVGVDVARGFALLSMFVAHTAPADGPGHILELSEYLTAPLFATLIGMGTWLGWRRLEGSAHRVARFSSGVAVRSVVLIGLGLLLERLNVQVIIVLVHLGVLTILAALLVRLPSSVIAGLAISLAGLGSGLGGQLSLTHISVLDDAPLAPATMIFSGYGVTHFLAWACLGILLARRSELTNRFFGSPCPTGRQGQTAWRLVRGDAIFTAGALGLAAAMWVARSAGLVAMEAYQRTLAEVVFDGLLCIAVVCGSAVLVRVVRRPVVRAVAVAGAMTLTLYVGQVLVLASFVALNPGVIDDSWPMLIGLIVGSLTFAVLWRAVVRTRAFARGPLEGVVGLGVGAIRALWPELSHAAAWNATDEMTGSHLPPPAP